MTLVAHGLLGLLEDRPKHGYELRKSFDERLAGDRPLRSGQVYSTLGRLERDGRVDEVGGEQGPGPERRLYAITDAGVAELERWLSAPEAPETYLQSVLYAKVVVALSSGRSAQAILDAQRDKHVAAMRALTREKEQADLAGVVRADFALMHLDADVRWIELTLSRLARLGKELRP
ncbi:MAG: PadR family transcriptional regulator [Actinobacteria bacterium]|nr:PadR family transcriptional regulator [Actinomycetota bacterium]MBV9254646.1 PadR family transcriptional regulator [Actinomycetota bacterium]MBV9662674.1 PadR family transcriptional regulator [Actinomycetota bacterium]MBV9934758.1 PadR family transcriptional regulator [Actinomycetota bacterium]